MTIQELNDYLYKLAGENISYNDKIKNLSTTLLEKKDNELKMYTIDKIYLQNDHWYNETRFNNYIVILEGDDTIYKMTKQYNDREGNSLRDGDVVTCEISEGKLLKVKPMYKVNN
jgi:hypothetical protein